MRKALYLLSSLALLISMAAAQSPIKTPEGLILKGVLKEESPIFEEPSASSRPVEVIRQYDFVFLFEGERNGFYRVGTDPTKAPNGWIPKDKIREWSHRICIHFTPLVGRQPALVFEDANTAEEVLRGAVKPRDANGAPHVNALAEEPGDLSQNRYSMILPVLDVKNIISNGIGRAVDRIGHIIFHFLQLIDLGSTDVIPIGRIRIEVLIRKKHFSQPGYFINLRSLDHNGVLLFGLQTRYGQKCIHVGVLLRYQRRETIVHLKIHVFV